MKPRLLIGTIHFSYLNGGGEHYPLNLAHELAKTYDVHFLCGRDVLQKPMPLSKEFPLHMVPFLYAFRRRGEQTKGFFGLALRATHYLVYVTGALLFFVTHFRRFPVVNTHDILSLQAALWAKRVVPLKVVSTLHGAPGRLETKLLRKADEIISVSEPFSESLRAAGFSNVTTIPTGFNPDIFAPGSKAAARKQLDLPAKAPIILFVGRMIPLKNIEHLIKALPIVHKKVPNAVLVLVGEGTSREKLEQDAATSPAASSIIMRPAVLQREVATYYQAADVLTLPSLHEAFPMVGVEALATGLPVLMTDNSPGFKLAFPAPLVEKIKPTDLAQTADQIITILTSDQKKRVAEQLKRVEKYTWAEQARKTQQVLKKVGL